MFDFKKLLREMPVELGRLRELHELGFKIVPLNAAGEPSMRWSDIYDNGWGSFDDVRKVHSKFSAVATCFGFSPQKKLYLNCLDVDSEEVFYALRDMENPMVPEGDSRSIMLTAADNTYMVKTRKEFGYHVYWLSSTQNPPIRPEMCRADCVFEIKTDKSGGMTTLPPSAHRSDPSFRYYNFGQNTIAKNDRLYGILMGELKKFLKVKQPEKPKKAPRKGQRTSEEWEAAYAKLQPWALSDEDVQALLTILRPIYEAGSSVNNMMMGLAGMFFKFNVIYESAESAMQFLVKELNDSRPQNRIWNLKNTYRRDRLNDRIAGYGLISETSQYAAKAIMSLLMEKSKLFEDEEEQQGVDTPPV